MINMIINEDELLADTADMISEKTDLTPTEAYIKLRKPNMRWFMHRLLNEMWDAQERYISQNTSYFEDGEIDD